MKEHEFDIGYRILDDDLIDSEGRRCGKVDDVEIEGSFGEEAHIAAIVAGPGAWPGRLPGFLREIAQKVFAREVVRVPWSAVDDVSAVVKLNKTASELRLGRGDDRARPLIDWLPGS